MNAEEARNANPSQALAEEQLRRMVEISRLLNSTLDLSELLQLIIQAATEMAEAEAGSIMLVDRRTGELYFAASTGSSSEDLRKVAVPMEGSIAGTIFKSGQPLIVGNVARDPRHYVGVDRRIDFETRSILGVPLQVRERSIGVLEVLNKLDGSSFDAGDVQVLQTLAAQAAIAIQNARLVAELRETSRRLAEVDKIKSDFISIASHELRTPLALVLGYAELLREQASDALGQQADAVLRNATRLQSIIESMTNLSYLESGEVKLDKERCVLQELVHEVCADWQALAEGKHLTLRVRLPENPITVELDRARMTIVLTNLLNNAVKFTPEGGRIEVALRSQTGMVAVSVADSGIGIPKEHLERIFEPFYQVADHMTRRHEGIGLGLSVAKGMVELHGGRIWAESLEGLGSRFTFTLPVRWDRAAAAAP